MKIIINKCYGGFSVKDEIEEEFRNRLSAYGSDIRTNPELIKMIEEGKDISSNYSRLRVVDITDNATDYRIQEYDGLESIIYVVDGKLNVAY